MSVAAMSEIEMLFGQYTEESGTYKKQCLLQKAFDCYRYWASALASSYSSKFYYTEDDDWLVLIQLGIWEGLEKSKTSAEVRSNIYYRVRHQISKEIQIIVAEKRFAIETSFDAIDYMSFPTRYTGDQNKYSIEQYWVAKIDIDNILQELAPKNRTIIKMWMEGFSILEICDVVSLKDAAVYNRFNSICESLETKLHVYKDML